MFEMVGPSSFFVEDWGIYGLDQNTEESRKAAAGLFGIMGGVDLTSDMISSKEYEALMKPISAYAWVNEKTVPSIIAYGTQDRVCPFKTVRHLVEALEKNGIDYKYFEAPHSGHGLQNDNKVYKEFMETVEEYLDKYMPVEK